MLLFLDMLQGVGRADVWVMAVGTVTAQPGPAHSMAAMTGQTTTTSIRTQAIYMPEYYTTTI